MAIDKNTPILPPKQTRTNMRVPSQQAQLEKIQMNLNIII